ncbi:MAG TPA: fibronectin type III domain-containing protein [Candidatus Angelobacter sp.]|nr:fibronectin type III domain-containing protein [Candidatus Angelobacter sp.]
MKRITTLTGLLVMLFAASAFAQGHMDANERDVRIVEGPSIINVTDHSARIEWVTNSAGANHVQYRIAGSRDQWQSAYHQGGGTHHFLELSGLEPGRTYEWEILTRDGDVRQKGTFQTEGHHRHSGNHDGGYPGDGRGYGERVPLYRSVSTVNGGHLYSTDANDRNLRDYRLEGPAGFILGQQRDGAAPLYRMSSANGDFLLTTDTNDINRMQRHGYRNDGVIGYIAITQIPGTQPFYRLVKRDGSGHFYTASAEERAQVLQNGWRDEGIAGYVWLQ